MEVRYVDPRLRDLVASDRALRAKFGDVCARKIKIRLSALRAAETLDDIMNGPGRCHPLKGDYSDCYALRLDGGMRLIFRLENSEEQDRPDITVGVCILVIDITDYHEG
ncbi:hypothetical protein GCM10009556_050670 [Acrocarpospora pleiomorpha]|uniref:type II toxin-antitoxin system RelE/ParE family toxin n=1 Tax=Acrocarpospora pleiomorpha TaxID=90975 RepID=UPI00147964C5